MNQELIGDETGNTSLEVKPERQAFGRFAPGNTVSLKGGRPPNAESIIAQLKHRVTPAKAARIANTIIRKATAGEPFYVNLLLDRLYGRVPQVTRIAGTQDEDGNERPIPILLLPPTFSLGTPPIDATPDYDE